MRHSESTKDIGGAAPSPPRPPLTLPASSSLVAINDDALVIRLQPEKLEALTNIARSIGTSPEDLCQFAVNTYIDEFQERYKKNTGTDRPPILQPPETQPDSESPPASLSYNDIFDPDEDIA